MLVIIWTRNLLNYWDYSVTENILFQGNRSVLLLKNNDNTSSGKRTNHINVRFFVTDRIQKGDISVEWCPINDITGYFFTNPNQGSLFRRFTDMIMGVVVQPDSGLVNPKNTYRGSLWYSDDKVEFRNLLIIAGVCWENHKFINKKYTRYNIGET